MYADGVPVRIIRAEGPGSASCSFTMRSTACRGPWRLAAAAAARRRIIARKTSRAATRVALVARLMRAAELQLHGIEQRLENAGYAPGKGEQTSRSIALLARTMRELAAIDERDAARKAPNKSGGSNDDIVPLDIDELPPITYAKA